MTFHKIYLNDATHIKDHFISPEIRKQIEATMPIHYYSTTRMTKQKQK